MPVIIRTVGPNVTDNAIKDELEKPGIAVVLKPVDENKTIAYFRNLATGQIEKTPPLSEMELKSRVYLHAGFLGKSEGEYSADTSLFLGALAKEFEKNIIYCKNEDEVKKYFPNSSLNIDLRRQFACVIEKEGIYDVYYFPFDQSISNFKDKSTKKTYTKEQWEQFQWEWQKCPYTYIASMITDFNPENFQSRSDNKQPIKSFSSKVQQTGKPAIYVVETEKTAESKLKELVGDANYRSIDPAIVVCWKRKDGLYEVFIQDKDLFKVKKRMVLPAEFLYSMDSALAIDPYSIIQLKEENDKIDLFFSDSILKHENADELIKTILKENMLKGIAFRSEQDSTCFVIYSLDDRDNIQKKPCQMSGKYHTSLMRFYAQYAQKKSILDKFLGFLFPKHYNKKNQETIELNELESPKKPDISVASNPPEPKIEMISFDFDKHQEKDEMDKLTSLLDAPGNKNKTKFTKFNKHNPLKKIRTKQYEGNADGTVKVQVNRSFIKFDNTYWVIDNDNKNTKTGSNTKIKTLTHRIEKVNDTYQVLPMTDNDNPFLVKELDFSKTVSGLAMHYDLKEDDPSLWEYFEQSIQHEVKMLTLSGKEDVEYAIDKERGKAYIKMPKVSGITLGEYLEKNATLSLDERLVLIEGIQNAIIDLHQKGICHLDLNLNNIMIDHDKTTGTINVDFVDFASAQHISASLEKVPPHLHVTTPCFDPKSHNKNSPEQIVAYNAAGVFGIILSNLRGNNNQWPPNFRIFKNQTKNFDGKIKEETREFCFDELGNGSFLKDENEKNRMQILIGKLKLLGTENYQERKKIEEIRISTELNAQELGGMKKEEAALKDETLRVKELVMSSSKWASDFESAKSLLRENKVLFCFCPSSSPESSFIVCYKKDGEIEQVVSNFSEFSQYRSAEEINNFFSEIYGNEPDKSEVVDRDLLQLKSIFGKLGINDPTITRGRDGNFTYLSKHQEKDESITISNAEFNKITADDAVTEFSMKMEYVESIRRGKKIDSHIISISNILSNNLTKRVKPDELINLVNLYKEKYNDSNSIKSQLLQKISEYLDSKEGISKDRARDILSVLKEIDKPQDEDLLKKGLFERIFPKMKTSLGSSQFRDKICEVYPEEAISFKNRLKTILNTLQKPEVQPDYSTNIPNPIDAK